MPICSSIAELIFDDGKNVDNYLKIWLIKYFNTIIYIKEEQAWSACFFYSKRRYSHNDPQSYCHEVTADSPLILLIGTSWPHSIMRPATLAVWIAGESV